MLTITITNPDNKIGNIETSASFDYVDVTIDDIYPFIEGMLVAYGFPIESIEDYYIERANEILQKNKNENKNENA